MNDDSNNYFDMFNFEKPISNIQTYFSIQYTVTSLNAVSGTKYLNKCYSYIQ